MNHKYGVRIHKSYRSRKLNSNLGGSKLSFILDEFLEWLAADGKWHTLDEFAASSRIEKYKLEEIAKFFARYKFIEFKENGKKAKIKPKMRQFIVSSLPLEEKPPVIALHAR